MLVPRGRIVTRRRNYLPGVLLAQANDLHSRNSVTLVPALPGRFCVAGLHTESSSVCLRFRYRSSSWHFSVKYVIWIEVPQETPFAGHAEGHERVQASSACDLKADPKEEQTYIGCVGKSLTSSLRVIKGRKSRRNRQASASEASPSSGTPKLHNSDRGNAVTQQRRSISACL